MQGGQEEPRPSSGFASDGVGWLPWQGGTRRCWPTEETEWGRQAVDCAMRKSRALARGSLREPGAGRSQAAVHTRVMKEIHILS